MTSFGISEHVQRYYTILDDLLEESFPELDDVNITVIECPTLHRYLQSSSFRGWSTYYIIIYKQCRTRGRKELRGQLAHELCHLALDYQGKSFVAAVLHVIRKAFSTLFNTTFNQEIERAIDRETIRRGYGEERLALAQEWEENYTEKELEDSFYSRGYLRPDEIRDHIH